MIEVYQKIGQTFTTGPNGTGMMPYFIRGTSDPDAAENALLADVVAIPGFSFQGVTVTELYEGSGDADGFWEGQANYTAVGLAIFDVGDSSFSFSTQGGTVKIKSSRRTRGVYDGTGAAANSVNFGGAIGVQMRNGEHEIEGCEADVQDFNFEETHVFANSQITPSFLRTLYLLSNCVNTSPVLTQRMGSFDVGELRFRYATGAQDGTSNVKITFNFHGSPNLTSFPIGNLVVNGPKAGQDYVWVQYKPAEDTTNKTLLPGVAYVVVEEIYGYADLHGLGIFS